MEPSGHWSIILSNSGAREYICLCAPDPHAQQAEWQSVARTGSVVTPEGNESYCTHAPARISQAGRTTGGCQTVIGTADPAGDGQETKMTSFDGTEQI